MVVRSPIPKHMPKQMLTRDYHQNMATRIEKNDSCHSLHGSEMRSII